MAINVIRREDENIFILDSNGNSSLGLKFYDKYPVEYNTSDVTEYVVSLEPIQYSQVFDKFKISNSEQEHKSLYKIHIKDSNLNVFTNLALYVPNFHGEPALVVPTDNFWRRVDTAFDQKKPDWICDVTEKSTGIDLFYSNGNNLYISAEIYPSIENSFFIRVMCIFTKVLAKLGTKTQLRILVIPKASDADNIFKPLNPGK